MQAFSKTLINAITVKGIGVHSGRESVVRLKPRSRKGVVFVPFKEGIRGDAIEASWENVSSTAFSTTLSSKGHVVGTVEHLLAASWALGIDSLTVEVEGDELPVLDGSAWPWFKALSHCGLRALGFTQQAISIKKTLRVENESGWLMIEPDPRLEVNMTVRLGETEQQASWRAGEHAKLKELLMARTFSFKHNVDAMRAKGFIKGGSLDNALVLDATGSPLNVEGWRMPEECAYHKILDLLGDWMLAGCSIKGRVTGYASGHSLNYALLKQIFQADKTNSPHAMPQKLWYSNVVDQSDLSAS